MIKGLFYLILFQNCLSKPLSQGTEITPHRVDSKYYSIFVLCDIGTQIFPGVPIIIQQDTIGKVTSVNLKEGDATLAIELSILTGICVAKESDLHLVTDFFKDVESISLIIPSNRPCLRANDTLSQPVHNAQ